MEKMWLILKKLYTPIELIVIIPTLFILNFLYFYIPSNNVPISIGIGVVGAVFFFYLYFYKEKQLRNYQEQLSDLLKYVTNMKFFLEIGENVLHSLTSTLTTISNKEVRKDIETTIEALKNDVTLKTDHFEKYNFPALNQFHQNLAICYEHGGNVKEMFDPIQKNMMLELEKRDELYKKRKSFSLSFFVLMGLIAGVPLLLRFLVSDVWFIFLEHSIASISVLLFNYFASLFFLYKMQKHKLDISVRI